MVVGIAVGVAGAAVLLPVMRRSSLPNPALYPLRTLAAAGVIYGAASVAHGSGFLAVFVAGVLVGDARAPYKGEIERFHSSLGSLAEIVVFVALGLTIDVTDVFSSGHWVDGVILAALLVVVRPFVVGALLARVDLARGEKLFIGWCGLKGAVPILLATFPILEGIDGADRMYDIVFVVVAVSVVLQGSTLSAVAHRLGVPMHEIPGEPWKLEVGLAEEPRGAHRLAVAAGSPADGTAIRDLDIGEGSWISLVVHDGQAVQPRGSYVLRAGDEVLLLADPFERPDVERLFAADA
jgi:cell volume regulation protein A